MAGIVRVMSRSCLLRQTSTLFTRRSTMATKKMTAYEEMNLFWAKNRQLQRPLSPHLSIYGYHLTMVMSITNRVLAVAIQGAVVVGSCALLVLPISFTSIVNRVKKWNLPPVVTNGFKYVLATPFVYHALVGIRHFVWDAGAGYKNKAVKQVSFAILAATPILVTALVFGLKPSQM